MVASVHYDHVPVDRALVSTAGHLTHRINDHGKFIPKFVSVRTVVFHAAVFTYGDRGTNVVAVFAAISAAVHIAELNREKRAN